MRLLLRFNYCFIKKMKYLNKYFISHISFEFHASIMIKNVMLWILYWLSRFIYRIVSCFNITVSFLNWVFFNWAYINIGFSSCISILFFYDSHKRMNYNVVLSLLSAWLLIYRITYCESIAKIWTCSRNILHSQ